MGAPVGCLWVPSGARCVLWFLLDIIRILKGKLRLTSVLAKGLIYQCFFKLSTVYPQSCPQGSLGLIWVNMGFDLDQLFAFG